MGRVSCYSRQEIRLRAISCVSCWIFEADILYLTIHALKNILCCTATMESAKQEIKEAIEEGDLEAIKAIIAKQPQLLRTPITDSGGTPLHLACNPSQLSGFKTVWATKQAFSVWSRSSSKNKHTSSRPNDISSQHSSSTGEEGIVEYLIDQEIEMGAKLEGTPSYNMRDANGDTPVFQDNTSTRMVESYLKLDDLEVTNEKGKPLLWFCAKAGRISERIACDQRLRSQLGERWEGSLPIEVLHLRVEEIHLQGPFTIDVLKLIGFLTIPPVTVPITRFISTIKFWVTPSPFQSGRHL